MKKYLIYLNVIASFAVVALHVNHVFWQYTNDKIWFSANLIESVFYFAVPIFFMMTGINLIGYREKYSTVTYAVKRIKRTVIPFLIWTCIGAIYQILMTNQLTLNIGEQFFKHIGWLVAIIIVFIALFYLRRFNSSKIEIGVVLLKVLQCIMLLIFVVKWLNTEQMGVISIVNGIFSSRYVGYFWYFFSLFGVYILIPLLEYVPELNRKKFFRAIIGTTLFSLVVDFIVLHMTTLTFNREWLLPNHYIFYAVLGYYIDRYGISKKLHRVIYILGLLGFLIQVWGTYHVSIVANQVLGTYKGYINLHTAFQATAIFLFIKNRTNESYSGPIFQWAKRLSKTTFGIYLIHYFVINLFEKVFQINAASISYRVLGPFIIFGLSSICVMFYHQVIKTFQRKKGLLK